MLTYTKLNDYEVKNNRFPLLTIGIYNDGLSWYPVFLPLMGETVFTSHLPILEADKQYLATAGLKKMPSDVVVTIA